MYEIIFIKDKVNFSTHMKSESIQWKNSEKNLRLFCFLLADRAIAVKGKD